MRLGLPQARARALGVAWLTTCQARRGPASTPPAVAQVLPPRGRMGLRVEVAHGRVEVAVLRLSLERTGLGEAPGVQGDAARGGPAGPSV